MRFFLILPLVACGGGTHDKLDPAWTDVTSPTKASLNDVSARDNEAWICGDGGAVLHSTDGARTWSTIAVPTTANLARFGGVSFGDPLVEYKWCVGDAGAIVVTKDHGATWAVKHTGGERLVRLGFAFVDGKPTFLAAGNDGGNAIMLVSTDDMATWQSRTVHTGGTINAADFGVPWLFAGDHGLVLESDDAGVTWTAVTATPTTADLKSIDAGQIVGAHTSVWRDEGPNGVTWSTFGTSDLPDLAALDSNVAIGNAADGHAQLVRFSGLPHDNMPPPFTVEDLGIHAELHGVGSGTFGTVAVGDDGRILVRRAM